MRNLFASLALAVGLSSLAAGATVATALAPLDTLSGALVPAAHADPTEYLPGGARDVVGILPAAGNRITVRLSNGAEDTLRPCRYEDGRRCYWLGSEMGNGVGSSFLVTRGRVHQVDSVALAYAAHH